MLTTLCSYPGCTIRVPKGRCNLHPTPARAARATYAWKKMSAEVRKGGVCAKCGGSFHPSELEAHHPISASRRPDLALLQAPIALCKPCHREITYG